MANIEAHVLPANTTPTIIYECIKDNTTISTIAVCNHDWASDETFSIWVVPKDDTRWDQHLIASANPIESNNSKFLTIWITPKQWTNIWVEWDWDTSFSIYWREWV